VEVLAAILKINEELLCDIVWKNTLNFFNIKDH